MPRENYSRPVLVNGKTATPLVRVPFAATPQNEGWLQQLLFDHPELIPFEDLDPLFRNSVPVAREVESGVGPMDIIYVNADGLLTIVETKLWRNPESRRTAVAQIINYASRLAKSSFEELAQAVDEANGGVEGTLAAAARGSSIEFDERSFHDGLSQNLKSGRFLLLLIGDGVREDVDEMAEFLGRRADLGFTLRLIEMAIFKWGNGDDQYLVNPHVIARTREVVRAIVKNEGGAVVVTVPVESTESAGSHRFKISEEEFFSDLSKEGSPKALEFVKWMIEHAADHQLSVQWMQAGPVFKHFLDDGTFFTLFQLSKRAWVEQISRFADRCAELELDETIWQDYFDAIVRIVPNAKRHRRVSKSGNEWQEVIFADDSSPLEAIADRRSAWVTTIDIAVGRLRGTPRNTSPPG